RWILDTGVPRLSPGGELEGFIGSCIDITEMRQAQERARRPNLELEARAEERDGLLQEHHHRGKDNLQVEPRLNSLQASHGGEPRALVEDGQIRIRSMALVHEKLYESRSLADGDLASYGRDLVRMVEGAIGRAAQVQVRVEAEPLHLG